MNSSNDSQSGKEKDLLKEADKRYPVGTVFDIGGGALATRKSGEVPYYWGRSHNKIAFREGGGLCYNDDWAPIIKKADSQLNEKREIKGLYRKRLQELTDENVALRHENEILKQKLQGQ